MKAERAVSRLISYWIGSRQRQMVGLGLLVAFSWLAAPSQTANTQAAYRRLTAAVDKTIEEGHNAILPPHISHLLGISPSEKDIPIKQFAEMGELIRGFDVVAANHDDIVMFVEDRSTNESTFYLTSLAGGVRKVLSIKAGVGYVRVPTAADKKAFDKEKQFWLDRLVPEKH